MDAVRLPVEPSLRPPARPVEQGHPTACGRDLRLQGADGVQAGVIDGLHAAQIEHDAAPAACAQSLHRNGKSDQGEAS